MRLLVRKRVKGGVARAITTSHQRQIGMIAMLLLAPAMLAVAQDTQVTTPTAIVTTTADEGEGSLRQALQSSQNTDPDTFDLIVFDASLAGQTITLTRDLPEITSERLHIDASNLEGKVTIDGVDLYRIFHHVGVNDSAYISLDDPFYLTVTNLVIKNGRAPDGGGIYSRGSVIVNNSNIYENVASGNGGGIYGIESVRVEDSTINLNVAGGNGGGIYSSGQVTSNNSFIFENTSEDSGGGIYSLRGGVDTRDSTISRNTAELDSGGGIHGTFVNIVNSRIEWNDSALAGGGISSGVAYVTNSTISSNIAVVGGGIKSDESINFRGCIIVEGNLGVAEDGTSAWQAGDVVEHFKDNNALGDNEPEATLNSESDETYEQCY